MRRALPLLLLVSTAGCQKDFDDRYAETEKQLREEAQRLDAEMAKDRKREVGEAASSSERQATR